MRRTHRGARRAPGWGAAAATTLVLVALPALGQVRYHKAIEVPAAGAEAIDVVNRLGSVVLIGWDRRAVQVKAVKQAKTAEIGERLRVEVFSRKGRKIRVTTYVRLRPVLPESLRRRLRALLDRQARAVAGLGAGRRTDARRLERQLARVRSELGSLQRRLAAEKPRALQPVDLALPVPQGRVDLEIYVPRTLAVSAKTFKHDLLVKGCRGGVSLSTEEGTVLVRDARGQVETWAQRGTQRLIKIAGKVSVRGGDADVVLRQIKGPVRAALLSGTIDARDAGTRRAALRTIRGEIKVGPVAGGRYSLRSLSGRLKIFVRGAPSLRIGGRAARWKLGGLRPRRDGKALVFGRGATHVRVDTRKGTVQLVPAAESR